MSAFRPIRMPFALILLLSNAQFCGAEAPEFESVDVFPARSHGYMHFRIPGIVTTGSGTVLAYCEARKTGGDWAEIDLAMRRSEDGGTTWGDFQILEDGSSFADGPRNVAARRSSDRQQVVTCNNPVAIIDRELDQVHFLYCIEYGRCFYRRSTNDGVTFSDPIEITSTFEEFRSHYDWNVLATGPGHGIQLDNGRLVVPVWLSTGDGGGGHRPSAVSVIYSDDHGETWSAGEMVVQHPDLVNPSETVIEQLADGSVMLNIRSESPRNRRAVSFSSDGATGWSKPTFDDELYEPICMASILRIPSKSHDDSDLLLFCNPFSSEPRFEDREHIFKRRQNLTIRLSRDAGQSWPVSRVIDPGTSGYCDLALASDRNVLCLYERGGDRSAHDPGALSCVRFNLEWVLEGDDAPAGTAVAD